MWKNRNINNKASYQKHAYCIIAHNDWYCLNALIKSIDDIRNDIYLHIDRKVKIDLNNIYKPKDSKLKIISGNEAISVYWSHRSQIRVELMLMEEALRGGNYSYFHIISGQDLPIKSQNYIHKFFEKNQGKNFIGFVSKDKEKYSIDYCTSYYIPLLKYAKSTIFLLAHFVYYMQKGFIGIQKQLNIKRSFKQQLKKGCNWASLTQEVVEFLISHKTEYLKLYKGVRFCDEFYKQTAIWNSRYRNTVYDYDNEYSSCLREIDWTRGNPYVYEYKDLVTLLQSKKLFARKFNSSKDAKIIDSIMEHIK